MSEQQVALLLQECLQRAKAAQRGSGNNTANAAEGASPTESIPVELATLLQEAADRKWPFVEEKWQYKQSVTSEDKINSSDLIRQHLPQLLMFLRDSIVADEPRWAVAVVFLVDRLLYWMDSSHILLKIAKALHNRYPEMPIAPQVIIRQARVYLNSGKLQKAEFILSSLINKNGLTGSWTYQKASDQMLVQAVSLQVRGQVLQKLGLWLEAFELIWASLVGFYALPQLDKKGIGTSLGILANILISMNDKDFDVLHKKPHIDFSLLGEHRLLSAARAAQMAVVYSQYASLYVLTNVVAQGTCLLSHSFSNRCSARDQHTYLALAKEAFEIGVLTNTTGNTVTSKLELHTLLKASYCLATTHRWMTGLSENITMAMKVCQEALTLLYNYSIKADFTLCSEIVAKIQQIKLLLKVESFRNSDPHSFIPDSYRSVEFGPMMCAFAKTDFAKLRDSFRKHHRSVCEAFKINTVREREGDRSSAHCITAFQIDTDVATPECSTENPTISEHLQKTRDCQLDHTDPGAEVRGGYAGQSSGMFSSRKDSSSSGSSFIVVDPNCCTETQDTNDEQDNYGSSEILHKYRNGSQASNQTSVRPSIPNTVTHNTKEFKGTQSTNQQTKELCTTEDENGPPVANKLNAIGISTGDIGKNLKARTSSSFSSSLDSSWEHVSAQTQSKIETMEDILDPSQLSHQATSLLVTTQDPKVRTKDGSTSSFSLGDSFGSHSSWEKLSISPVSRGEQVTKIGSSELTNKKEKTDQPLHASCSSNNLIKFQHDLKDPTQSTEASLASTESDPFEELNFADLSVQDNHQDGVQTKQQSISSLEDNAESCHDCFMHCIMGSDVLTERDYRCLFAGVCHSCLIKRLPNKLLKPMEPSQLNKAYESVVLKYSKASDMWMGFETSVYIGNLTGDCGKQRRAIELQYLHQEQPLSSYVGKEYLQEKGLHAHLDDVERQMSAQHYVTEFNKRLYDNNVTTQIFFIPSEVLLVLEMDRIITCLSAEPYMSGHFLKLTNNTKGTQMKHSATKYGIAFGHFSYEFSHHEEVVVDLQGWVTTDGKGLTYLTDPQIHSIRQPRSVNFGQTGINNFLKYQHGEECNEICRAAGLTEL